MKIFRVIFSSKAKKDLAEIGRYIRQRDSIESAKYVVSRINTTVESLKEFPLRGTLTKEMLDWDDGECREIYFKPYRIVYEVVGETVNILVIADGRRDMKELLNRRLSI